MKYLILLCCFAFDAIAEKQLKLEDIERDNLASERDIKQQKDATKYSQPYNPPTFKAPQTTSSNSFGFTPIKPSNQVNQDKFVIPQNGRIVQQNPVQTNPVQDQLQYVPIQYYYQQQQQQQQPVPTQLNTQYQPYENVPYVVDNQVNSPQYVYVQPYAQSSNNIQMVVDSKGQIKYYMYLPVQYVKQDQVSTGIQYKTADSEYQSNIGPQIFNQEPEYQQENQYITQSEIPAQTGPQISFIPAEKSQYAPKGQPNSLLDSYVPSVLQYQYYKQQQQQGQNSLGNFITNKKTKSSQKNYSLQPEYLSSDSSAEVSYSGPLSSIYSKSYSTVKGNTK